MHKSLAKMKYKTSLYLEIYCDDLCMLLTILKYGFISQIFYKPSTKVFHFSKHQERNLICFQNVFLKDHQFW